jgi:biopolymer transport protein ExbB
MSAWLASLERLADLGGPFLWLLAAVGIVAWTAIVEAVAVCWTLRGRVELAARLAARLWLLRSLAGVAPLLGLLGTVSGIIACFGDLGGAGRRLASGIAESLLCTAAGLVVAIPAAVAYALLARRAAAAEAGRR